MTGVEGGVGAAATPPAAPLGARFRRLLVASAAANVADGVMFTAVPLLAATLSRDPVAVSGIQVALFLPWLLFALPSGAVVDRVDRRAAMAAAGGVRAAVVAGLAVAVAADAASLPAVYLAVFLLGTAETVYESATRALLPAVVPADALDRGNGRLTVAEVGGQQFAGPPVGSALFGAAAAVPFALAAGGYAVAGGLAAGLRGDYRAAPASAGEGGAGGDGAGPRRRLRTEIAEGLGWLARHRFLRRLTLVSALLAVGSAGQNAIAVLYALEVLGVSEQAFGLLLAAAAVGAVLGGATAPVVTRRVGRGRALVVAMVGGAAAFGGLAACSSPVLAAALYALVAWSALLWNVVTMSLRQVLVPEHLFGRVFGAWRVVVWGVIPVGAALGGVVADAAGLRAPFVVAAAAHAAALVAIRRSVAGEPALSR